LGDVGIFNKHKQATACTNNTFIETDSGQQYKSPLSKQYWMARLGCAVSRLIRVASAHDGEAAGDGSGVSVSLSSDGTTVAIGARLNAGNGSYSGHVRIYAWQ